MTNQIIEIFLHVGSLIPFGLVGILLFKSAAYLFVETPVEKTFHTNLEKITRFFVVVLFTGLLLFSMILSFATANYSETVGNEVNSEEVLVVEDSIENNSTIEPILIMVAVILLLALIIVFVGSNIRANFNEKYKRKYTVTINNETCNNTFKIEKRINDNLFLLLEQNNSYEKIMLADYSKIKNKILSLESRKEVATRREKEAEILYSNIKKAKFINKLLFIVVFSLLLGAVYFITPAVNFSFLMSCLFGFLVMLVMITLMLLWTSWQVVKRKKFKGFGKQLKNTYTLLWEIIA